MRNLPKDAGLVVGKPKVPGGKRVTKGTGAGDPGSVPEKKFEGYDDAVVRFKVDPLLATPSDVARQVACYDGVCWAAVVGNTLEAKPNKVWDVDNDWDVIVAVKVIRSDNERDLRELLMRIAACKGVIDNPANIISQAWGRNGFP